MWLKNPISKEIVVDINTISLASRSAIRTQRKISLDVNNKAALKVPLNGPSIIKLMNACKDSTVSLIAIPGVDLAVHLDGLGKDTTNYNEIGSRENNFYRYVLSKSSEVLDAIPQQDPELFLETWSTDPPNSYDAPNPGTALVGFEITVPAHTKTEWVVKLIPEKSLLSATEKIQPLKDWK